MSGELQLSKDLRYRLRGMMERAPSDASSVFLFRRTEDGFKGLLKIRSKELRVVAGGAAATLEQVVDQIDREVATQLAEWRRFRFS